VGERGSGIEEVPSSPPLICPYRSGKRWRNIRTSIREKRKNSVLSRRRNRLFGHHDAWRVIQGSILSRKIDGNRWTIVQGVIHHETGHALHHGAPEFYTFRFSNRLQEAGRFYGLNLSLLQQCVYLLSVAIKDQDVTLWLARMDWVPANWPPWLPPF